MGGKRQKSQEQLAFPLALLGESRGEAPRASSEGTEPPVAAPRSESPTGTEQLMEEVVAEGNIWEAQRRVQANKGSPGVDGMRVSQLPGYLEKHWPEVRKRLLAGSYRPQPVKRVRIPKPDGGERLLGIPTVLDRLIQQAILQVLQPRWDGTFSEHSYGFRPGRSARQAVGQAQRYIEEGNGWVVDIDLERFFDRINHDRLMSRMARRVADKRLLKLTRAFLNAGVLEGGLVSPTEEGTPQGGPLSPLLSNLVLDELDGELERRGHRFVRYADDCNIYVRSPRAGERVMASVTQYVERKLKLRVNQKKSAVARPKDRKFLGFSFTAGRKPKRRIAPKAVARFKERVRELTGRNRGKNLEQTIPPLRRYLLGWVGYFGYCQTPSVVAELDSWIRRRLRCLVWKQWKRGRRRYPALRRLGVSHELAWRAAKSSKGPWRLSSTEAMHRALGVAAFEHLGLPTLEGYVHV